MDLTYPIWGGLIAKANGKILNISLAIPHYSLLTSGRADKTSMFIFMRVKG